MSKWLSLVMVFLTLFGMQPADASPSGQAAVNTAPESGNTFAAAAETLRECGIEGITDEFLAQLEADYHDFGGIPAYEKPALLLEALGYGDWDPETWEWSPSSSSVYSFDTEAFDISSMYSDFLRGAEAIGNGELSFTDVTEDGNSLLTESGIGTMTVRFNYNGVPHSIKARALYDWFDVRFISALNKIIEHDGKKLYYTNYGQSLIVFYRDRDWAKQFERKTGISLSA